MLDYTTKDWLSTASIGLTVILGCLTTAVVGWWLHFKTSRFHRLLNRLPGPTLVPFLGNALKVAGGFDQIVKELYIKFPKLYGEIFRFYAGSNCYVGLVSPELVEVVLSSQKVLDKGPEYDDLVPWLGHGLLISTGDKWRSRRKLLTPAFHFKILDSFVDVFNKQGRILCHLLNQQCNNGELEPISIHPLITRCSLDIICEAAMGTQVNAQTKDSQYAKAVYKYSQIVLEKFLKPWLTNETVFSFTADGREYPNLLKELHKFTDDIINKKRQEFEKAKKGSLQSSSNSSSESGYYGKNRPALLDLLLEAEAKDPQLTHQDIREEIDTFMFEGHDTVSSAMSWFLYSMASNPHHQERVYDELCDVFEDDWNRDCNQQDLNRLKYLECCIKESLRLYPSVPAFTRVANEDLQLGGYLLPAGCIITLLPFAMHRNPRLFHDPLVFNPDRFTAEQSVGRHPYAYIPFSAGPRNCIGQRFAMMEEKTVLSLLLRKFRFSVAPLKESTKQKQSLAAPIPSNQVILKALNGIHLFISPR